MGVADMNIPKNQTIFDAMIKCEVILDKHNKIMVSISGGSDSDVMLDMIERCKAPHNEIDYVFFDTGIEFQATKDHIKFLEEKYNITINRTKPVKSIPKSCKDHGQPFMNKTVSENISRLQRHNFQWEDAPYEELIKKYPKCQSALSWWTNNWGEKSSFNIERRKWLKEFMVANPPQFLISQKCCQYAKKELAKQWKKEHACDLSCIGMRQAEGGQRAMRYKSCFTQGGAGTIDEFRPIFWLSDKDKEEYIEFFKVQLSDCYTKYGLRRTGCSGCPFALGWRAELAAVETFEPKLANGIKHIFADSYAYLDKYEKFCEEMDKKYDGISYAEFRRRQKEEGK